MQAILLLLPVVFAGAAEMPLDCAALADPKAAKAERAAESRTIFGHLMLATLTSKKIPAEFRSTAAKWCAEKRFLYDPEKSASVTWDGMLVRDKIVLGTDVQFSPRSMPDWSAGKQPCSAMLLTGNSLFHEMVHLTSGSEHGDGKPQETWTGAWGQCLASVALAEYAARRARFKKTCLATFEMRRGKDCAKRYLDHVDGFRPPDWWPYDLVPDLEAPAARVKMGTGNYH